MRHKLSLILFLPMLILSACNPKPALTPDEPQARVLTIMTHDSFAVSASLVNEFESQYNVQLRFIKGGDTGAALNRAILLQLKGTPAADVFYGLDNTFLSRAWENDIFESYAAPALAKIDSAFKLDPQNRTLPVNFGDVCINYDKNWFAEHNLAAPQSLEALTQPEYAGLLVVENPAVSSPGLAFLVATIAHFDEGNYLDFWQQLVDNDLVVVSDWETAYYTNFSASSGRGPQPMVVSYASSPPAELIYADPPLEEAPTASIIAPQTCFRQIEFVGILKGTPNRDLAEKFVDFMLSRAFQEDLPLQMFVFPVLPEAILPPAFQQAAQIPDQPATMDPLLIGQNREQWIQAWSEVVLP